MGVFRMIRAPKARSDVDIAAYRTKPPCIFTNAHGEFVSRANLEPVAGNDVLNDSINDSIVGNEGSRFLQAAENCSCGIRSSTAKTSHKTSVMSLFT